MSKSYLHLTTVKEKISTHLNTYTMSKKPDSYKGPETITTIDDVKAFINHIIVSEEIAFHPDNDFIDYVILKDNGAPLYPWTSVFTQEEADFLNHLLAQCFDVCDNKGIDIYTLALNETQH